MLTNTIDARNLGKGIVKLPFQLDIPTYIRFDYTETNRVLLNVILKFKELYEKETNIDANDYINTNKETVAFKMNEITW